MSYPMHTPSRTPSLGEAYESLKSDFVVAFIRDPECKVPAPAWGEDQTTADLIYDRVCGHDDEFLKLMRLIQRRVKTDPELMAWVREQAHAFAEFNCNDLVLACEENT